MEFFKPAIFFPLFILATGSITASAQNAISNIKISGVLTGDKNEPIAYASVNLLNGTDSTIVKGTLSSESGSYIFDNIKPGNYFVAAASIGYNKALSKVFYAANGAGNIIVPLLQMYTSHRSLQTVTITASRPLIEYKAGEVVVNVENSVLAAGNSAMEILQRAPGVSIDNDDNIKLEGKQGVKIMIDDKLTYLSGNELAALLRSTDGNTIQSIEIMSTPPAKYDASGNAGIINIKLKRNKQAGTSGSIAAGAAVGKHFGDNMSLNLNHKEGSLNLFGTLSRSDTRPFGEITLNRIIGNDITGFTFFDQQYRRYSINHNNNYRVGTDYETSQLNTIGLEVSGYSNGNHGSSGNLTIIQARKGVVDSSVVTNSDGASTFSNIAYNVYDKLKLDSDGQEIRGDAEYSKYKSSSFAQYNSLFFIPNGIVKRPARLLTDRMLSQIDVRAFNIDYTKPFSKTSKLEAGIKYSNVKTDNDLQAQTLSNGNFIDDTTQSNHFIYNEKISAGYVNFNGQAKNTVFQLGLRAEYARSDGDLIGSVPVKRHYLNFFPSVLFNHSFDSKNTVSLSYSRRIDRPGYDDLNPFTYYLDPFTFRLGNAFLQPQYSNKYEAGYSFDKTINLSISYNQTTDVISNVVLTSGNKSFSTYRNLNFLKAWNLGFNSAYQVTKWWTGDVNFNGFYQKYEADTLAGAGISKGKAAFQVKATASFLFADFKTEVEGAYESATVDGVSNIKPYYGLDAGISHSILHKKVNVRLSISDIFKNRAYSEDSRVPSNYFYRQTYDSRLTRLTITYNFGNNKIPARQHTTAADDEAGRVKAR